ncbi:MAG: hypothetical protein ACJ77Z_08745, partial [Thermoleophilaceae bacterium]
MRALRWPGRPILDHSIRTFLFARLLAEHEGCLNDAAYDEQLLFVIAACDLTRHLEDRELVDMATRRHEASASSKAGASYGPRWTSPLMKRV